MLLRGGRNLGNLRLGAAPLGELLDKIASGLGLVLNILQFGLRKLDTLSGDVFGSLRFAEETKQHLPCYAYRHSIARGETPEVDPLMVFEGDRESSGCSPCPVEMSRQNFRIRSDYGFLWPAEHVGGGSRAIRGPELPLTRMDSNRIGLGSGRTHLQSGIIPIPLQVTPLRRQVGSIPPG